MSGLGGMISFVLDGAAAAAAAVNRLAMFAIAPNLGGWRASSPSRSPPPTTAWTRDERAARGIADNMIRLSVGLEDPAT